MRHLRRWLCVLMLGAAVSGCEGFTLFVSTGPLHDQRQSPTSPPPPTPILVGDVVDGVFIAPEVFFDVRPAVSGTLFIRLQWDSRAGDLDFTFLSAVFATDATIRAAAGPSSAVRSVQVIGGQVYRIAVVGGAGQVPFTLATSMQPGQF